jgi:D-alanine-D-alanine ligase
MDQIYKKKVALIYGGESGEHEVSCRSAHFVWTALSLSYEVLLIGVSKEGKWYWQNDQSIGDGVLNIQESRLLDLRPEVGFFYRGVSLSIDCVFPVIHGSHGEDGRLQALLDMMGIPYAGTPFLSSAICMDKALLKTLWEREKIPTLPFVAISDYEFSSFSDDELKDKFLSLSSYPLCVKPSAGGSSLGVSKVASFAGLKEALIQAFKWDSVALVEPFGDFREIECAILGKGDSLEVCPLGEINYGSFDFYNYEAKYENDSVELDVPASLSPDLEKTIKEMAKKAYRVGRCEGFARVDFFVDKHNEDWVYVNEINTIPGLTKISLFPKMCLASGLTLSELGEKWIEEGIARFHQR